MEDNVWKTRLTSSLRIAWKEQLYTDLTIVTQDEVIHVHKLVLAVASPYFRALLNSNLSESRSNLLKLDMVRGETLKIILEYVYTGRTHLKEEDAAEILSLADYFQIHDLKRLCCIYIKKCLTPSSCLSVYELAVAHQCYDLAGFAFQMALKNCSEAIRDPSFLRLQPSTLVILFKQQILGIASEDELLKALMKWKACDEEGRRTCYSSLLFLLNEEQMEPVTRGIFRDEMEEWGIKNRNTDGGVVPSIRPTCPKMQLSRHKKEEELLIVFGGESSGRILGNAECFSLGYSSWRCSIPNINEEKNLRNGEDQQVIPLMKYPRTSTAIASRGNVVYLIGGQNSSQFLSSCETYHLDSNEWNTFPELPFSLHGAAATFLNDQLWVVGGRSSGSGALQDTVLVYDENKESWCSKPSLLEGRVHFGIAAFQGCLFAIGGLGVKSPTQQFALSSCEKFDIETNSWTPIAPLEHRRAYHGVVVFDDFIYAIGGYDGKQWLSSVERYDPFKDRWIMVSPMMGSRSSFGVTISRGRIYCIGGFSGESVLNTVEKYNPRIDMWHCVQSMQLRRYGLVASTLKLPSEKLASSTFGHQQRNPDEENQAR